MGIEEKGWTPSSDGEKVKGGANVALLEEFLASGEKCVMKDMGDDSSAMSKRNSLTATIRRNPRYDGITVAKRGTLLYIMRGE